MELTSTNNEKVKKWVKLKQKKYRDVEKLFLVEDEHLVNEALNAGVVKEIITTDKSLNYNALTYYVTDKIMKLLSSQVTSAKVIAVCKMFEEKEASGNLIILDKLQDPGNLGTILRSAVAFNFNSIILSDDSVDLYNPKVVRSSEGMIFYINVIRTNISKFLDSLNEEYTVLTTNVENGKNIKNIHFRKCAIVIGNEGSGVSDEVAKKCDESIYINMNSRCESLNAAVSASIIMYEVSNE